MNMIIIRYDNHLYDLDSPGKGEIGYAPTGEEILSLEDFIEDRSCWIGFKMEIIVTGFTEDDITKELIQ